MDAEQAHLRAEVHGRNVFQVVRLVEHEAAIRREHRRLLPVVRRHAHREIRREQVMVHDDYVGFGGPPARLEQETTVEMGALEPRAEVRLGRHRIPHVGRGLVGEVRKRAVARASGPGGQRIELGAALVLEQRVSLLAGLLEPRQADVVPPALEQRERRRVVAGPEGAREDREVLADELLLQIDRVGRDDGALTVLPRPHQCRDQVGERFTDAGPRLEQPDTAVVVQIGHVRRHVALAGTILEAVRPSPSPSPQRPRHRTARRE